jgi:hypothetical protein
MNLLNLYKVFKAIVIKFVRMLMPLNWLKLFFKAAIFSGVKVFIMYDDTTDAGGVGTSDI